MFSYWRRHQAISEVREPSLFLISAPWSRCTEAVTRGPFDGREVSRSRHCFSAVAVTSKYLHLVELSAST